ncbi:hypothetical protein Hanom_Chr16g01448781 [Helianthus anomalus]
MYENDKKKKELMNEIKKNLDKMSLDVIVEIEKRIYVCLVAKNVMKYDIKRGCYIDENMNPLDFVKFFCARTYKTETKQIPKKEESEELVSLNSEPVLNKEVVVNAPIFDHSSDEESDGESVQVEKTQVEKIPAFKVEKKADDIQILEMCLNCEKSKSDNVKLLKDVESLTLENKISKKMKKNFKTK